MQRLPDWLIVGAPKAGTTSLAAWLRSHPQVFVPAEKEVGFFDTHWDRGVDWYARAFAEAEPDQVVGEATPLYLYLDHAVDRIARTVPSARLVVALREPAARAWSHVWFFRLMGVESRDPREVLERELADPSASIPGPWDFGYLDVSRYVGRLEHLVTRVPRAQVHVLFAEDMRCDADGTFGAVCDHLGVERRPAPTEDASAGSAPRSFRVQQALLRGGERVPRSLRRAVWRTNRRPGGYPALPADLADRIRAHLAEDTARLAAWLDRDLPPTWTR